MALITVKSGQPEDMPWGGTPQQGTSGTQAAPQPVNYTQSAPTPVSDYAPSNPPPYAQPIDSTPIQGQSGASSGEAAVQQYYRQYLGREANPGDPATWLSGGYGYGTDLPTIENAIRNSPEAQAYASRSGGAAPSGSYNDAGSWMGLVQNPAQLAAWVKAQNPGLSDAEAQYYTGKIQQQPGQNAAEQAGGAAYWGDLIRRKAGGDSAGGGGGGYAGTSVFSDPATANFEKLLNDMVSRFNTPATPPDYQAGIDQMKAYLAKLNGPTYTPAQMELMQTQALDPMQQQQDAARQQLIARMGAQGIGPNSGITEKALEDLNRQFQQARTTTQANFATNAIGLDRQNAATAAGLAPQISALEQAQTGWQDQRAQQAATLAAFVPQMAMQRLQAANGSIQQLNPTSLLTMLQSFQNQGYNQGANYGSNIMQLLSTLFGLGGQ